MARRSKLQNIFCGWRIMICISLICSACSQTQSTVPQNADFPNHPTIVVIRPARHIGVIPLGDHKEVFEIHNIGDELLKLQSIKASCGCVNTQVDRNVIQPGGSTRLTYQISPRQSEQRSASATIQSNDPTNPQTVIRVEWIATGPIQVSPEELDFGIVRHRVPVTRLLVIHRDSKTVPRSYVSSIKTVGRANLVTKLVNSKSGVELHEETWEVTLTPDDSIEDHRSRLNISLLPANLHDMFIPVRWQLRSAVQAAPRNLFLGVGGPREVLTKSIEFTSDPGVILKVKHAS